MYELLVCIVDYTTTCLHIQIARFMGQHGAHLGPVGLRRAPCWPHEPCYQGNLSAVVADNKRLSISDNNTSRHDNTRYDSDVGHTLKHCHDNIIALSFDIIVTLFYMETSETSVTMYYYVIDFTVFQVQVQSWLMELVPAMN